MASNYTEHYQLPIWDPEDSFLREEFNETHQKIDDALAGLAEMQKKAGNCRYVCGSYTGTGSYGSGEKTSLTFDCPPLAVFVLGGWQSCMLQGATTTTVYSGPNTPEFLTTEWAGNTVRWHSGRDAIRQLNESGTVYRYLALLDSAS